MWCDVWRGKYFIMSLARPDILSGARSARYYAMKFNQTAAGRGSLTHSGLKRNCVRWLAAVTPRGSGRLFSFCIIYTFLTI